MRIFTGVVPQLLVVFGSTILDLMHSSADKNILTKALSTFAKLEREANETSNGIYSVICGEDPGW